MGRGIVEPRSDETMRSPPHYCTDVKDVIKLDVGIKRSNLMSGDIRETPERRPRPGVSRTRPQPPDHMIPRELDK